MRAIKRCKRHKSPGPDRLVPGLGFRIRDRTLPKTFLHAHIQALPKVASPRNGLDFRPIAMLDSDYKVYARVWSSRFRFLLPKLIGDEQTGFVPGRSIHDTIDVMDLLLASISASGHVDACAVSLDFSKAYDTTFRPFMVHTLEWMGFPPIVVGALRRMHEKTTACFIVNQQLAAPFQVTRGIRQGCPLAPLLFILTVEVLHRHIDAGNGHGGLMVRTANDESRPLRSASYVDDTTFFCRDQGDPSASKQLLQKFGKASGLKVNNAKTTIIPLHPQAVHEDPDFTVLAAGCTTRHLGIQRSVDKEWQRSENAIQAKLGIAVSRTTVPIQRIRLVQHIAIPKILYIARHIWPTKTQLQRMQKLLQVFIWTGTFDSSRKSRGWVASPVAEHPLSNMGLMSPMSRNVSKRWQLSWFNGCISSDSKPYRLRRNASHGCQVVWSLALQRTSDTRTACGRQDGS
ncbi:TPA: hypothetical protein N0F65_000481 [Lagenidium giganteum]|uniref:Reverse transcriptase domain-containing protein n=1 Tax=Lagenidium giganteum TaxID=4803 RepID=A0AAV2YZP0_9STRA|nr:TPA: hypothetical protein N0F65_000481 [Lagenidium giganteum]